MCGIAGIVNIGHQRQQHNAIQAMTTRMAHRGPDAEGIYVQEDIALGHRRLSIIDLSESANQPMTDVTDRYIIVFNGEIYNYREVKSQLTGYAFRTKSDSEVILAAYTRWGKACLSKFNGMFAFAIWDKYEKELFIARDRVGKKPLYYFLSRDFFVFGSEVRSLLSSGIVPKKVNDDILPEYLMFQAPMSYHTLIKDVQQLEAGHYGILKKGILEEKSYWTYDHLLPSSDSYVQAKQKVHDLFMDSIRLRMVSDVPVSAFLSGGIDSSLVVACMAELSEAPVETFSISFNEKAFDESKFAEIIARKYKTNHHRIVIESHEFLDSIDEILSAMDSPSGDGYNTYLVARQTRQSGIKVALSGLGGDELFAGYNKFLLYHRIIKNKWILNIPFIFRKQIASFLLSVSKHQKNTKLADVIKLKDWNLSTIYPELRNSFRKTDAEKLVRQHQSNSGVQQKLAKIENQIHWMDTFSKCTIGEIETYTRDVLLRDTDQMAMAHALEVRVPFFDYKLLEYVLCLPDAYKYPSTPKKLLVDAFASKIPESISNRKKMGFSFPMDYWLRNDLSTLVRDKLTNLSDRKEFNGKEIQKLLFQFQGKDSRVGSSKIWQLVVLSDWLERNKL